MSRPELALESLRQNLGRELNPDQNAVVLARGFEPHVGGTVLIEPAPHRDHRSGERSAGNVDLDASHGEPPLRCISTLLYGDGKRFATGPS
jgi:hypothetical protein